MSKNARFDDKGKIYLGERLRDFREGFLKISQAEMAEDLNISQRQISEWESGKRNISREEIILITKKYEDRRLIQRYRILEMQYYDLALGT